MSAFSLDPVAFGPVDWMCSDVIAYPARLLTLVQRWIAAGTVDTIVCTVKLQGNTDHDATDVFAAMKLGGADFMFHIPSSYRGNELHATLVSDAPRGVGVELRCYHTDPDVAETRARDHGFTVLAGALDKPHGLRECMIMDDDGYVWIPSRHLVK